MKSTAEPLPSKIVTTITKPLDSSHLLSRRVPEKFGQFLSAEAKQVSDTVNIAGDNDKL